MIPVRLEGLDRILHHTWKFPVRGTARVAFGAPLRARRHRLRRAGRDGSEQAVRDLAEASSAQSRHGSRMTGTDGLATRQWLSLRDGRRCGTIFDRKG